MVRDDDHARGRSDDVDTVLCFTYWTYSTQETEESTKTARLDHDHFVALFVEPSWCLSHFRNGHHEERG